MEILQCKEVVSMGVEKKTKEKVKELEKQSRKMKEVDSLGSVHFNDLCIHTGLNFLLKFKCPDFKKYDGKGCPYVQLRLYGVAIA